MNFVLSLSIQPIQGTFFVIYLSDRSFNRSVDVVFGCLATVSNECHQDGNGTFSVGDTKVMYNETDTSGNHNFCNFTVTVRGALKYLCSLVKICLITFYKLLFLQIVVFFGQTILCIKLF